MAKDLANAQDLVDIEEIRKSTVILKNGRMLKIVMVDGVNFSLKSEEEQNIITFAYQNFLNGLDFPLQAIVHSRKINIEKYLSGLEKRQSEEPSALLQNQIAEYREFIKSFVKENPIMEKTFLTVVPFSPTAIPQKETITKFFPFFKKDKDSEKRAHDAAEATFEQNLSQLDQRVSQVTEGLRGVGLETEVLNNQALIELFYNFYNPETIERENIPIPQK